MRTEPKISDTDLILDELDRLARSAESHDAFCHHFLSSLRSLLGADSAAILIPFHAQPTLFMQQGEVGEASIQALTASLLERREAEYWHGELPSRTWIAVPMASTSQTAGWLMVTFASPVSAAVRPGQLALANAFGEVYVTRQTSRTARQSAESWNQVQSGLSQLTSCESMDGLHRSLVDQVALLTDAARVSLAKGLGQDGAKMNLIATSGVSVVEPTSPTVLAIAGLARDAASSGRPLLRMAPSRDADRANPQLDQLTKDGVFENALALPLDNLYQSSNREWLIIEWANRSSMADRLPSLGPGLQALQSVYGQQSRWCSLPAWLRQRAGGHSSTFAHSRNLRVLAASVAACGLVWLLLRPYPMVIDADAVLEPVARRIVHATADGMLVELFVEDGDKVTQGQPLAQLKSPPLELQIEETLGQMKAMAEKRNGLNVAINQLSPNAQESLPTQTRLSTELLILQTQEKHIRDKLDYLKREQERLLLKSPIDGVVIASALQRELENRPLRRGDPLFQVAELDGDWELRIQVSDRDTGYVNAHYGQGIGTIEYVLDSLPGERFQGEVQTMVNVVENIQGAGSFRTILASVARDDAHRSHMGAIARVSLTCGQQPFWFVWSRPLIEYFQKRIGFTSRKVIPSPTPAEDYTK